MDNFTALYISYELCVTFVLMRNTLSCVSAGQKLAERAESTRVSLGATAVCTSRSHLTPGEFISLLFKVSFGNIRLCRVPAGLPFGATCIFRNPVTVKNSILS